MTSSDTRKRKTINLENDNEEPLLDAIRKCKLTKKTKCTFHRLYERVVTYKCERPLNVLSFTFSAPRDELDEIELSSTMEMQDIIFEVYGKADEDLWKRAASK